MFSRECLESIDYVVLARIALLAVVTFYCISSMVAVHLVLDFFYSSYSTAAVQACHRRVWTVLPKRTALKIDLKEG